MHGAIILARMSELPPLPPTPLGRYRHYKGGDYEVIGVARHSETREPLVVYRPLCDASGWWVRPHAMFFETVLIDGRLQPRFQRFAPA
jgi:hypothetical protein